MRARSRRFTIERTAPRPVVAGVTESGLPAVEDIDPAAQPHGASRGENAVIGGTPASRGRLPSLDGARAVAISIVCMSHISLMLAARHQSWLLGHLEVGDLGVRVFFILSGFLITGLLLRERAQTGGINLARFYLRRTLRIFPAFYAFLLVVVVLAATGIAHIHYGRLLPALTYTSDYLSTEGWPLAHTWSLAVEEQFYLVWPAAIALLGARRGGFVAAATIVACPLIRLGSLACCGDHPITLFRFESQADALATGCLLACLHGWLHGRRWYLRLLTARWLPALAVVAFLIQSFASHSMVRLVLFLLVGFGAMNLCIVLCLDRWMTFPGGPVGRLLNSRAVVLIGLWSYSIYLWQQIFLDPGLDAGITRIVLNLLVILCIAAASYYAIEQPARRLRGRIDRALWERS